MIQKLLLLDLYGEAIADLQFLQKIKDNKSKDNNEQIENILSFSKFSGKNMV